MVQYLETPELETFVHVPELLSDGFDEALMDKDDEDDDDDIMQDEVCHSLTFLHFNS
ncbi:hypothetical protein K443DRAFT_7276 [Laccaria amethystina LaAM-08-1]|uniref:Uncharacterized protein n=1 Tax=Laccaria amethystina LaAM-08-1 TaxID=1095629 RepID=A0A0C9XT73_9AGAR|nr:hypothetical protein K443DRAFT_7276 [Laccaria amethystina LaAM-08-1]